MSELRNFNRIDGDPITSEHGLPIFVYTPASAVRSPVQMVRQMYRDLSTSRELAWRLMVRDISSRYRQSFLGVSWALLSPIVSALIFVMLNRYKIINVGDTEMPYPAFVMFGTILWQLFTISIRAPLQSVESNKFMLAKTNFSREALLLAAVGQTLFDLGIRLPILLVVFLVSQVSLTWGMLLVPFAMFMLILLGIALGLLITPIGALYRDVSAMLGALTNVWFYLTPVIYPLPQEGPIAFLGVLNPVSPLLSGARDLATKGTLSAPIPFAAMSVLTLLVLVFAWIIYRLSMPILIERMGA